jgi:malate dehydrogenase (oxaloacetate-decarboxylating)
VISGAGAAGVAVTEMLLSVGITDIVVLDSQGIISADRHNLNPVKESLAQRTNPRSLTGGVAQALDGADVFIGVSSGTIAEEYFATMSEDAMIFAMSNPDPEIDPQLAKKYAKVVATGRSDYPNQINNVLAFPGIFRGALDSGARRITQEMKIAAAQAIADLVVDELSADNIVPSPLDERVCDHVARAVANAYVPN